MAKLATSLVLFSSLSVSVSATLDSADVADEQACEMQTTLLQTKTEMRDAKRHVIHGKSKKSNLLAAVAEAKAKIASRLAVQRSEGTKLAALSNKSHMLTAVAEAKVKVASRAAVKRSGVTVSRQEACAIADETDDNTAVASLVPNNELVCYQGTKRELDQAYCFLGTAPTRGLYRAGDSPWFQGDAPADVEVELESCESRGYELLLHDPDDCWAPVQKWIRSGEAGEVDFDAWEWAQAENWDNYDAHYNIGEDSMNIGLFLSGCICLPGTDVMDAMQDLCEVVDLASFMVDNDDDAEDEDEDEDEDEEEHDIPARVSRHEACAIADETDDNTVVASLVPNNELVCYQGTKRELDQAYCFLETAPTRALYRAGDSPWFQGDAPADVEVELGSCESRGYELLLHDPDDCWAPVQKWIRSGEAGEVDFDGWESAQFQNWENYDAHYGIEEGDMNMGIFLSGCICLPGTDVMDVMQEICDVVDHEGFLPMQH